MLKILYLGILAVVKAAVIDIDVGKGASLSFEPNTVTADIGDTLAFHFYNGSGGHSVVAGTYTDACEPEPNAFFSGYIKGDLTGEMTFLVQVNSTDPIWFYCSLNAHCLSGMVGVVNPAAGQTVSSYIENASGLRAGAPAVVKGGILTTLSSGVTLMTSSSASENSSTLGVSAETTMPTSTSSSRTVVVTTTSNNIAGSSSSTPPGLSAETTMPTATTTRGTTTTPSTNTGVAATSTPTGGGKSNDASVMLGLGVLAAVFVSLMS